MSAVWLTDAKHLNKTRQKLAENKLTPKYYGITIISNPMYSGQVLQENHTAAVPRDHGEAHLLPSGQHSFHEEVHGCLTGCSEWNCGLSSFGGNQLNNGR